VVLAAASGGACAGLSHRLAHPSQASQGAQVAAAAAVGEAAGSESPPPPSESDLGVAQRLAPSRASVTALSWSTLTTEHFIVHTDARGPRPGELLAHLERVRASLASWFDADPVPMEIILFGSDVDYLRRFPDTVALHVEMSAGRDVFVTHLGHKTPLLEEVTDQALVVRFVDAKFGPLPTWLADGIVTHFGTAKLQQDKLFLGAPPTMLGLDKEVGAIAPVEELFAADAVDIEPLTRRTLRTSAWALVGYLLDESVWGDKAAARFQAWVALAGRNRASAKAIGDAFTDIYPDASLAGVSVAYTRHARAAAGTHRYQHFIAAPAMNPPAIEVLAIAPDRIEPVLRKAQDELAVAHAPDPRETAAVARWRDDKPIHQMRMAFDWAEPMSTYGLAYGYSFRRDHSVDFELGKSVLGYFLAARYRADFEVENARNLFANLAIGPTLALKNTLLGLQEPDDPTAPPSETTSFYHLAMSGEVATGAFLWRGLYIRVALTLLYKLATNLEGFCKDPQFRHDPACPEVSRTAGDAATGFLRLGAGYAW
jgi:hypothetical protein